MTDSLVHRGPDDSGHYLDGSVGLGFRRLAILDLSSTGHQPIISDDERFVLVFNGEIYNYVELRKELINAGYGFRSSGDSEVLLNAYRHWGMGCLSKLNGMWAFILYDRSRHVLLGSRDRFGVKPLFIHRRGDFVLFASEIKAIRASGVYRGGINWTVASRFLLENALDDTTDSFYEGIESIPAGSAFELSVDGSWKAWRYWDLNGIQSVEDVNPPEAFAQLFEDAVRLRMRSDVPVGVSLSGGLDSTAIICAAARQRAENGSSIVAPLQAFSYTPKEFDESKYIADTLDMSRAELSVLDVSPKEMWDSLPRVLWHQDEPVHTMTAVVGYHLMNLASKRGIRVVLNGQGADETIGGYFSYFADYWLELCARGKWLRAVAEIRAFSGVHGDTKWEHGKGTVLRLAASLLHRVPLYRAISRRRYARAVRSHPWFTRELTERLPIQARPGINCRLDGVMKQAVRTAPLPLYLRIEDRNSMAHSVEARLPFLDYRLVLFLSGLPPHWKLNGPWNKWVLREGMKGRIPESVRIRPDKMGFPTPGRKWFAHDLYEPMADILSSRAFRERGIYNVQQVIADLARHKTGDIDVHRDLFNVAEFEILESHAKAGIPAEA
jgi:asparagine synthase (glutamine-hydrolysing)